MYFGDLWVNVVERSERKEKFNFKLVRNLPLLRYNSLRFLPFPLCRGWWVC